MNLDALCFVAGSVMALLGLIGRDMYRETGSGNSLAIAILSVAFSAYLFWQVLS